MRPLILHVNNYPRLICMYGGNHFIVDGTH
ncbi:uncharacterized protein METZ01_LOCUS353017, partial [marine metagenome]